MVNGKSLTELATEIERQSKTKRDFIVPDKMLAMFTGFDDKNNPKQEIAFAGGNKLVVNDVAHGQFAAKLGIPKKYYDRMRHDAPDLLRNNVNEWLHRSRDKRMVRTLDGNMRAYLSDRYRPLDNFDLCGTVFPFLSSNKSLKVKTADVTEQRMYIQVVSDDVRGEVKVGDMIRAGIVISNSEVGCGALSVERMAYRLVCMNGMIRGASMSKYHLGRRFGSDDESIRELLSDATKRTDDKAFFMKVNDVLRSAFDPTDFANYIEQLKSADGDNIEKKIDEVVELTQREFGLSDGEKDGFLKNLIEGGSMTRYGMANAVTAVANNITDYDRAVDLERMGGEIIELPRKDWERIAV